MAVAKKKPASTTKKAAAKKKAAPARKAPVKKKSAAAGSTKSKAPAKKTAPKKAAATTSRARGKHKAPDKPASMATQLSYLGIAPYQEKKGEAYMGPKQIEHFRLILDTWKSKLIEEMERTVHHMRDEAANFPDPNDRASQESDFALELRTRDRERKLIKKIDESLHHLDNDDYGYCETCGVEIGIRRLEARPTATLCIDCKTLDEIRERQVKG